MAIIRATNHPALPPFDHFGIVRNLPFVSYFAFKSTPRQSDSLSLPPSYPLSLSLCVCHSQMTTCVGVEYMGYFAPSQPSQSKLSQTKAKQTKTNRSYTIRYDTIRNHVVADSGRQPDRSTPTPTQNSMLGGQVANRLN